MSDHFPLIPRQAGPTFTVGAEAFTCSAPMPAGALAAFTDPATGLYVTRMAKFMADVLIPEDRARFKALIDSGTDEGVVDAATLDGIVEVVVQKLAGFPTLPPSDSSDGRPVTPSGSEDASLSPASTPTASTPEPS